MVFSLMIIANSNLSAQEEEGTEVDYSNAETWLLGDFTHDQFFLHPHYLWFESEYEKYVLDEEAINMLRETSFENIDIVIVLGTWCSDSRREVPRFIKLTESWGYPTERIRLIGVDSYKEAPIDEYGSFEIERVATFIIYKDKIEEGRIIEYPTTSLERDMISILNDN